jgi:hypothetical protein
MFERLFWRLQDTTAWHKCRSPFFPQRTVDGSWTCEFHQTCRRMGEDGQWQYKQDEGTEAYCCRRSSCKLDASQSISELIHRYQELR